jgi:multidrug resistance efflux pump
LTIPEQFVSTVGVGQPVDFEVDAYPGRRFTGTVKYISPALQADRRALDRRSGGAQPRAET